MPLTETAGERVGTQLFVRQRRASFNNNAPPLTTFAGASAANVLALQAPLLLMKVLRLDSGEVESRL